MNAKIIKAAIIYFQQNLFYAHQFVSETVDNEILENLNYFSCCTLCIA